MATVQDVLARKGSETVAVAPTQSVLEAAQLMNTRGIGGVLVTEGKNVVGVFTERDILRRVVAERRDPAATSIRDVMTTSVVTCNPETSLEEVSAIITTRRIRHLPVVGAEGLCGVITSGDVLAHQVAEQQDTIQHLNNYVYDVR